jgi:hypothetical protein
MRSVVAAFAVALVAAGCSGSNSSDRTRLPNVSPDLPPAPSSWPRYPKFSSYSCWARPTTSISIMQVAPSLPVRRASGMLPSEIVRRLLARFGDRTFIRRIEIGKQPPHRLVRHVFPGKRPPKDAVWAYFDAPSASISAASHATPERVRTYALALASRAGGWRPAG